MHDDQHGTAIISGAALLNALEVAGKKIDEVKVVVSGAGSAAISCSKMYVNLGVKKENILMCDSKGPITTSRTDLNEAKKFFAVESSAKSIADAVKGADVFLGVSKADILTPEMLLSMAANPVVLALANPKPEIEPELAVATRSDIIFATGRSDYPNQVNNVLGFPYIFRGALDTNAKCINEEMKIAATRALAALAHEPVTDEVKKAYGIDNIEFGRGYILPKPFDKRLIVKVSSAKAAVESGVARNVITDWDAYKKRLAEISANLK